MIILLEIRIITQCKNIYVESIRAKFELSRNAKLTDITEIRAFRYMTFISNRIL